VPDNWGDREWRGPEDRRPRPNPEPPEDEQDERWARIAEQLRPDELEDPDDDPDA
jgi:hypothetical protein